MGNTERLYRAMKEFTEKQNENREIYLRKKKSLEGFKGSARYQKDLDEAMKIRKDADKLARERCSRIVNETLEDMQKKNATRGVKAPSEEMIRILTVAKEAWKGDENALERYGMNYGALATEEIGTQTALNAIQDLGRACGNIMKRSGAKRTLENGMLFHYQKYGGECDPDDLPREKPYTTEQEFYDRELSVNYQLFHDAVD